MKETLIILGLVVLIPAGLALSALLVMLIAGALGHAFNVDQLYISYWQSLIVALALGVLRFALRG